MSRIITEDSLETLVEKWRKIMPSAVARVEYQRPGRLRSYEALGFRVLEYLWLVGGIPSQTPALHQMFSICASLHCWLKMDQLYVALLLGKRRRTSMVVACYLRYVHAVDSVLEGFNCYCNRRPRAVPRLLPANSLPPSVITFFNNFNGLVETEMWPTADPLTLKSVLVEGVPVEDLPVLDVYDFSGILYSSHDGGNVSQHDWQADEGQIYRIGKAIDGDFYISCRFGGEHAYDVRDERNYLFRYSNSTRFLAVGEIGLGLDRMDREYRQHFEDEGFSMALIFGEDAVERAASGTRGSAVGSGCLRRGVLEISSTMPLRQDRRPRAIAADGLRQ